MIVATSFCANFLPKARVLAASLRRRLPAARLHACIVEKTAPAGAADGFAGLLMPGELGFASAGRYLAGRTPLEAATAVKPALLLELMGRYPRERDFWFLDPDTEWHADEGGIPGLLARRPILLAPHLLEPGHLPMELSALNHGAYNLGFLAVRRSPVVRRFLEWWRDRLAYACWDDRRHGLFTDQKWIDLVPGFFGAGLLTDPGCDVAPWNFRERRLTGGPGRWRVNGKPLRFVHYSGLDSGVYEWAADQWAGPSRDAYRALADAYRASLAAAGQEEFGRAAWSYARLDDGTRLPRAARRWFRHPDYLPETDPYALSLAELRRRLVPDLRWPRRLRRRLGALRAHVRAAVARR